MKMSFKLILYFLLLIVLPSALFAQQKRLYIANDDHTDYMWTANEAKYDSAFVKILDYSLMQIDSTKNFPSNFQARFNCDGSLWLKKYQKYRSDKQFNKLIAAIKSGHISSPLNMLVNCYGAQPTEAVIDGKWKYIIKEDNPEFSKKDFNDSGWAELDTLEWKDDISGIALYLGVSIDRLAYEIK